MSLGETTNCLIDALVETASKYPIKLSVTCNNSQNIWD